VSLSTVHTPFQTFRRSLRGLISLALLGALGAACTPPAAESQVTPTTTLPMPTAIPATAEPTQTQAPLSPLRGSVSIWTAWEAEHVAAVSDLMDGFRQQHPRVQVRLSYYRPAELLEAFETATAAGRGPTILLAPSAWGPALLRAGLIVDVTPRLLPEQRSTIPELLWSQVSSAGALVGLPVRLRGVVLYRNRSLAAQPAASLDDLLTQAEAVSIRHAAEPVFDLGFAFSGAQLTACGGTLLRAGGGLGFDEKAGVCWLNLLSLFRQAGRPVFNSNADRATFIAGHSPWLIDTTDALPEIVQALGAENVSIDAWPRTQEDSLQLSGYVWSDNAYFSAGASAADLEASWALASLLIGPEGQARLGQAEGAWFLSVLQTVQPLTPLAAQAQDILFEATAMPLASNLEVYTLPLERAVLSVVAQAADPLEAVRHAAEVIRDELTQSPPGG
jgi:arabinogalactan oligomer / maltooligosaccharide transport system substrate-binding protein